VFHRPGGHLICGADESFFEGRKSKREDAQKELGESRNFYGSEGGKKKTEIKKEPELRKGPLH